MYKYLLFDLDGTLTNPEIGITSSVMYALEKFDIKVENRKELHPFIGPPLSYSFQTFYGLSKEDSELAVKYYRERFSEKGLYENEVYDGVDKMLQELKEQGNGTEHGEKSSALTEEWFTLSVRYKKPAEDTSNLLQYPIGYECYDTDPSDDFRFAAAVAEFGLLASHSENPEDASVKNVKKVLKDIDLDDEYKEEFLELVKECD